MQANTIFDCNIIHLHKIHNRAGNLTPVTSMENIPFEIKRIYYLYDVPGGETRGAHAHYKLEQLVIAASGSFDITLDDGINKKTVNLSRPYLGLHIKPGTWRDIQNFSSGAICLVLASELYNPKDYMREYEGFLKYKKG
jgi:dTDP-4-dehydrorhamnose 3,5-epimerase-like enzyme